LLGEDGLTAHLTATDWSGADSLLAVLHKLLAELGTGVTDDTALLALSVPAKPVPPAQELR